MSEKRQKMEKKTILSRLLVYVMEHKWMMLLAIFVTVTANLLALVGPYLSGLAIDAIGGEGQVDFEKVFFYGVGMAVCYLVSAGFSYILQRILINVSRKIIFKMRSDVFNKLSKLPVGYYDTHSTGDILSVMSYDIDTINTSLSTDLIQIFSSTVTVFGALFMMITISPKLVLVFCVTVPLSVILTKKLTGFTRPLFRKRSAKLGELNGFVEEMVGGQKTLKAYNREERTEAKFKVQNDEAVEAYYKADYYGSTVGPSVSFVNNLSLSLVSLFGALLFLKGGITIGNISSFVLYSRKFSGPINEVANIIGELQSTFSAAERVFRLLDENVETLDVEKPVVLGDVQGDVELENVDFGYSDDKMIVKNLSIKAPKGSLIAIVGPTGAGKTTIINLLMRFYDTQKGEIYLDSKSITQLKRKELRLAYSMVLQETWLFSGTVYENIAYGKENATMEDVVNACKSAGIHDFVMTLADGYNTVLQDDGSSISKGQKQLLTIARAMIMECELLILDEATSNVDTRTEIKIQQAMRNLMDNKTCFVIAHRLSTIKNADLILVLNAGEVVEQGTHKELMAKQGFYHGMFNSQFE